VEVHLHFCENQSKNHLEAVKMKKELKIIWAAMASLILVAVVCALPPHSPNSYGATHEQTAAQSISGKIAEVQKTSLP